MKKISYLVIGCAIAFASCKGDVDFKKAGEGVEYKIFADGKGDLLKPGQFIEFYATTIVNRKGGKDSILNNGREAGAPQILEYDSTALPPVYFKIFAQLKNGDSLVSRVPVDTIFKAQPDQMPPFLKKGDMLMTTLKITNIYKSREAADSARRSGMAAQEAAAKAKNEKMIAEEQTKITDYLTKNKINAVKSPKGVFVQIVQQGSGPLMDTATFARIKYDGRLLDGTLFDSNIDPSKGHPQLLMANLTNDPSLGSNVIVGLKDALLLLAKGAKAKIFIPSPLGYGAMGAGRDVPPNSILVFDVEVVDAINKSQAAAVKAADDKKMEELQKKYADSVAKTQQAQTPAPQK